MGRYIYKPGLPVRVKPGVIGKLKTVVEKSASGDPVHITDAAKDLPARDLAAAIGPVQDLHGYDAPWPAGGGKNLLDLTSITEAITRNGITATPNGDGTFALSGTAEQADINIWLLGNYDSQETLFTLPAGTYTVTNVRLFNYHSGFGSVTPIDGSSQITFSEDQPITGVRVGQAVQGTNYTGTTLKPQIEAGSSATSFAPYSNICPITGRTGVNVTRTGKNLLPNEITQAVTEKDVTFEPTADGGIYIHGTNSGSIWQTNICQNLSLKAGEYIISIGNNLPTNGLVQITNRANNYIYCSILSSETYKNFTVTKAMENDMRVRFATSGGTGIEFNVTVYPMIRLASIDDADFEPYQGKTVTVEWTDEAGTVYGGEYDVTTGVLTVTHKAVDMGSISWYLVTNYTYTGFRGDVSDMVATVELGSYPIMCSYYPQVSARGIGTYLNASNDKTICRRNNDKNIMVQDTAYATVDAFKTAVAGQTVVYELASPFTVQLTAGEEVRMLGGENNLWADTGSVRLDYYGDIQ
ncbi:MAG: hypothetical protein IJI07_05230 [Flexilinea sp.]|nr:hypothetical protein [Flexilinea sp.]